MGSIDILFMLIHLTSLLVLVMFFYIAKKKNKSQIHYVFLSNLGLMVIWCLSVIVRVYLQKNFPGTAMYFEYLTYVGICFIPVTLLLTGLIFAHTKIHFSWRHLLLFVVPVATTIIIWTNDYHHLFYKVFFFESGEIVVGPYFFIHTVYSYVCTLIGLYYLVYFSIKNSGFFSKQALLIFVGTIVPLMINILYTLKVAFLSVFATPLAFSFLVMCYVLATLKYNFLNIAPIAMQKVVDLISDSFVVINEQYNIIDYNKTFLDIFSPILNIKRNYSLLEVLSSNSDLDLGRDELLENIKKTRENKKSFSYEKHIKYGNFDKYFSIEITPITSSTDYIGTIILLKDITQSKKDLEVIKENQMMLMERERLASLGQLIGGIAHNLKTPIMSLAGGIEALKDLVREYDESIEDINVNKQDHHEIAQEMLTWLNKMKPYCSYMSDIISAVKGQAILMNDSTTSSFTLDELMKRVSALMKHELKRYHCRLNTEFLVDMNTELKGEVNNLVQVFDNIIVNAIQAYEEENGQIDLKIVKTRNYVEFSFKDYGKGISDEIKDRLFKEMVTTKGKNGTGLGLYMSYATIKGKFGGNMWFESEEGKGTTFYISLPCEKDSTYQEVS